jgi:preprotein translocase SecA subunit
MFKKLFGGFIDSNEKAVKRFDKTIERINALEPQMQALSDEQLHAKTDEFRNRLKNGEALDDILDEAFAAVREAGKRALSQRHFDVQLIGGVVLHLGRIAEMKTGEGKTLVATLPSYLNALQLNEEWVEKSRELQGGESAGWDFKPYGLYRDEKGNAEWRLIKTSPNDPSVAGMGVPARIIPVSCGVHVVTVNDYLSKRDCQWMGPIYHMLGLSVATIQHEASFLYDPVYLSSDKAWPHLRPITRREAYEADITYGTNNEFGFDYLRDNMVVDLSQCVQRDLNYAIVDEVDNILIDEARTPLIISGPAVEAADKYKIFSRLTASLTPQDYEIEEREKAVKLTDEGMSKMENMLRREGLLKGPDLYDPANYLLTHYLESALKARVMFKRDREYVIKNGEVIIVDEFTGRMMPGRRYSEGLHQAIEAKEGVHVQRENITMATITFQNYFRMYDKLAGMTGTAVTEAEEFHKIYKLEVVVIPTNKNMIRQDATDLVYQNEEAKFRAVTEEIKKLHDEGKPVLVGTASIERSEHLREMLLRKGFPKEFLKVLNAKDHEKEAASIAQAGCIGAVTVATNMAGRGVDIVLGGNPEEIAKEQLSQEWAIPVEKESGGASKILKDLESDHEKNMQQLGATHEPKLVALGDKRDKAGEALRAAEKECKSASPFFGLFKKLDDDRMRLTEAEHDLKPFPSDYRNLEEELERALFDKARQLEPVHGAPGVKDILRNAEKAAENYQAAIRKYDAGVAELASIKKATKAEASPLVVKAKDGLAQHQEEMGARRQAWLKSLEDLDFALLHSIAPAVAQACDAAEKDYVNVVKDLEQEQKSYDLERSREEEDYDKKKRPYELKLRAAQKKIESAPEYDARLRELTEQHRPKCVADHEKVVDLGGLRVIGTERHEARRIDNQLRGRSGRQGDPGSTRFYVSLEDEVVRRFGGDRIKGIMERFKLDEDMPIENSMVMRAVEESQKKIEGYHFDIRKHLVEYDDVINAHREIIYDERHKILSGADMKANIKSMVKKEISDFCELFLGKDRAADWDAGPFLKEVANILPAPPDMNAAAVKQMNKAAVEERLLKHADEVYEQHEKDFGADKMRLLERLVMLRTIDKAWVEHLTSMEQMRQSAGLEAIGQRDPLVIYKGRGHEAFEALTAGIEHDVSHTIFKVRIEEKLAPSPMAQAAVRGEKAHATDKPGRNDLCPCGSGKKYKKCCGK